MAQTPDFVSEIPALEDFDSDDEPEIVESIPYSDEVNQTVPYSDKITDAASTVFIVPTSKPSEQLNVADVLEKILDWFPRQESGNLCTALTQGNKIGAGRIGNVYRIVIGGQYYVVKLSKPEPFERQLSGQPAISLSEYEREIFNSCITMGPKAQQYLGMDEFSNEAIIGAILTTEQINYQMPEFFLKHYDAFVCDSGLAHLMEEAEGGNMASFGYNPFTAKYLRLYTEQNGANQIRHMLVPTPLMTEICKQFVLALLFGTREFGFTSGDLKAANLFYSAKPVNHHHRDELYNLRINCPFTVKIGDYGKSALTYPVMGMETRIFNRSSLAELYFKLTRLPIEIVTWDDFQDRSVQRGTRKGIVYGYRFRTRLYQELFAYTRHAGTPFYQSFDVYTLIVSLAMLPQYHYPMINQPFWRDLWLPSDYPTVMTRIKGLVNTSSTSIIDALNVLDSIMLRCDALEYIGLVLSESRI
jgi:hypothetical protein